MPIHIVDSSPKAIEKAKAKALAPKKVKYPFNELEVGKSFTVPFDEGKYTSLRSLCFQKRIDKKEFELIVHEDLKLWEVARIA